MLFAASNAAEQRNDRPDRDRPEAERRQAQRREHRRAHRRAAPAARRTRTPPSTRRSVKRAAAAPADCGCLGARRRGRRWPRRRGRARRRRRRRTSTPCPRPMRSRRATGPNSAPRDGSCERRADQTAAPPGRRRRDEPCECAGPGEGAREPLQEACEVELPRLARDPEEHRADRDRRQPDHDGSLSPRARRRSPLGMAPTNAPAGYAAASTPAPALPEAERVRVVRQQRRERCEEQRVEEDDRSSSGAAACASRTTLLCRSGMRRLVGGHRCRARCVAGGRARRARCSCSTAEAGVTASGMSQWGAEGYARHGYAYTPHPRALLPAYAAHDRRRRATVRVLLEQGKPSVRIGSACAVSRRRRARPQGAPAGAFGRRRRDGSCYGI